MKVEPIIKWIVHAIRRAGWAPLLIFVAHVVASRSFDAYTRFPLLDIPMHFFGGLAIAHFFHHAKRSAPLFGLTRTTDTATHWILVFALTCSSTVFWEFAEFIFDRLFGTHTQLGVEDTIGDMFAGIVGGLALLAIHLLLERRSNRETL